VRDWVMVPPNAGFWRQDNSRAAVVTNESI
jgi:hypothetical protein